MPKSISRPWRTWAGPWALRLVGLAILVFLLIQVDIAAVVRILLNAEAGLVVVSALGMIPLIGLKTVRWQRILHAQSITYPLGLAFLAYFGSLFIGYLTPGRLGEFIKAFHVSRDRDVSFSLAFSSVLADRLFDLYAVLLVGAMALARLADSGGVLSVVLLPITVVPLVLFLHDRFYGGLVSLLKTRFAALDKLLVWLSEIRAGLRALSPRELFLAIGLTALAYLIFYGQCYLLALALDLPIDFGTTAYAVSLGSLLTLLPISIAGLGTREAATVAYLGSMGIPGEAALSFAFLVFAATYIASGLVGAVAWLLRPVPLNFRPPVRQPQL